VHISQSGVSAQIRQLEHDLGATLIDRSGRTATLTQAGEVAVKGAREILAASAALRQSVEEVTGLLSGRLTVGMVTACTITALFDALATFHRAHPRVAITLLEGDSATLVQRVHAGALDIALIGAAGPPPGLEAHPIVSERLAAAAAKDHPLSGHTGLTLNDLTGLPLICMPAGTGIRTVLEDSCLSQGLKLEIAMEASAAGTVMDLAARGLGVAVVSETIAATHSDRLWSAVVDDASVPALLSLVWKPALSPAAAAFLTHCRRAFGGTVRGRAGRD